MTFPESIALQSQLQADTKVAIKNQIQNQLHAGHETAVINSSAVHCDSVTRGKCQNQQAYPLPRCIAGFTARPTKLPEVQFDGHLSLSDHEPSDSGIPIDALEHINTVFLLSCKCGSDKHYVIAYAWARPERPNEFFFLSPLALECVDCKALTDLIDTDIHGYDAELGNGSATMRGEGKRDVVECTGCDMHKVFHVYVRFEYPDDLLHDVAYKGRQQDRFTWFSLIAKCDKCGSLLPVADYECA